VTIWGATFQETHIRASFSSPHRVMARAGGGVGAHPVARVAPRKRSWAALLVMPDRRDQTGRAVAKEWARAHFKNRQ